MEIFCFHIKSTPIQQGGVLSGGDKVTAGLYLGNPKITLLNAQQPVFKKQWYFKTFFGKTDGKQNV